MLLYACMHAYMALEQACAYRGFDTQTIPAPALKPRHFAFPATVYGRHHRVLTPPLPHLLSCCLDISRRFFRAGPQRWGRRRGPPCPQIFGLWRPEISRRFRLRGARRVRPLVLNPVLHNLVLHNPVLRTHPSRVHGAACLALVTDSSAPTPPRLRPPRRRFPR